MHGQYVHMLESAVANSFVMFLNFIKFIIQLPPAKPKKKKTPTKTSCELNPINADIIVVIISKRYIENLNETVLSVKTNSPCSILENLYHPEAKILNFGLKNI